MLAQAWCVRGWAELEEKHLPAAENYLRAAWQLGQDRMSGYQLGRLLEAKGNKTSAAHLLELAHVTSIEIVRNMNLNSDHKLNEHIGDAYKKITGKELTSTPLNHGEYNGSLRAELDKDHEIHGYIKSSKFNGQAIFTVAYEDGKPVKAYYLEGDESLAHLTAMLENHRFQVEVPTGSKARLLREVRLICSPYGGCDAYMLLPNSIMFLPHSITPHLVTRPNGPSETKPIQIEIRP